MRFGENKDCLGRLSPLLGTVLPPSTKTPRPEVTRCPTRWSCRTFFLEVPGKRVKIPTSILTISNHENLHGEIPDTPTLLTNLAQKHRHCLCLNPRPSLLRSPPPKVAVGGNKTLADRHHPTPVAVSRDRKKILVSHMIETHTL